MFDIDNEPVAAVFFDIATEFRNFVDPSVDYRTITVSNVTLPMHGFNDLEVAMISNANNDYLL